MGGIRTGWTRDQPLALGVLVGGLAGAWVVGAIAANTFKLYHYVVSGKVYPGVMDANIKFRMYPRVYDWGAIIVWAFVGLIVGAFLGAVAVTLLRIASKRADS